MLSIKVGMVDLRSELAIVQHGETSPCLRLRGSLVRFVEELELLTTTVLDDGPSSGVERKFRDQLAAFDKAVVRKARRCWRERF